MSFFCENFYKNCLCYNAKKILGMVMIAMNLNRNEKCWCGSGKKYKQCHLAFDEKLNGLKFSPWLGQHKPSHDLINNEEDIAGVKASAKINMGALDLMNDLVKAGVSTEKLNAAAHEYIESHGGRPACLHFRGFPKSICTSINNVVCHGIPSEKEILKDGDIINVDITTIYKGYYADSSRMFLIGDVSDEAKKLVEVTKDCMNLGILAAKPWHFVGDIGAACAANAKANGFSVVTALGGHGVGKQFHAAPFVSHDAEKNTGMLLVPGMILTVEPMINAGRPDVYVDEKDDWTVRTVDGSLSAQWEKTILITETGTEVLCE